MFFLFIFTLLLYVIASKSVSKCFIFWTNSPVVAEKLYLEENHYSL